MWMSALKADDAVQQDIESQVKLVAQQWLSLIDAQKYSQSWSESASLFRSIVPQVDWIRQVESVRDPLGKLKYRQLMSLTYKNQIPGGPDGQYVVIQYMSEFENNSHAVETITPMFDIDNQWRVAGYFIK
jgi:Protein of unknown function (DUF4019)